MGRDYAPWFMQSHYDGANMVPHSLFVGQEDRIQASFRLMLPKRERGLLDLMVEYSARVDRKVGERRTRRPAR